MKKLIAFASLFIILCSSCKKETINNPTQAQLTATKLEAAYNSQPNKSLTGILVYVFSFPNGQLIYSGNSFNISSDGFITVSAPNTTPVIFNLGELKYYEIIPTANSLNLFF